ncbi:amylovoran biosynthesis protein AmsK [Shimwellia blattae DSM 4481 = NBRC 105725]|uniref:Amylovoran biosynthesis protein AmsK n=1 Tax=Shimwellia blattae (strain ATCC 29907 / DSM 4481 / JCM 1650 / NBRC 105725 / CDC 9005-74) TaxID=630626 RepID=I2B511_SHIBC|nr:glycosyltransferase [Shimwellia blattae]AFJ45615.1 amylovoran biosynthesis protein AmsK [Shimwellia blattae DSM 4481 = NBRC 105725]GAB81446.1 putative glycosyltransferase [Shimwellia blattae DSM 4481 = NBRC 105725]
MKILIFNTLYYPYRIGGAEVSVQILAEELVKKGHSVRVVSCTEDDERSFDIINGVELVRIPLLNCYWPFTKEKKSKIKKIIWHILDSSNFFMDKKIKLELDDFLPDIVHTNNVCGFSSRIWKTIKNKKYPLIHTSRDYYLFHPNSTLFRKNKIMNENGVSVFLWSMLRRRYSSYVDTYVGISKFILELHVNNGFFKNKKTSFIYNPVKSIVVNNNNSIKNIGFIGRLSTEKGFDIYCNLSKSYSDKYNFIAAGDYVINEKTSMELLANRSGVDVRGYMSLSDFLSEVDAVVLPIKWNEPFGRTVVECALAGKFVISNRVGAITELADILPNVILLDNVEVDFNCALQLVQKGKTYTGNDFDASSIADKYVEQYNNTITSVK